MFYLIHGKSRNKSTDKAYTLIKGLIAKKPDASYIKLDSNNWNESVLEELGGTQGLFENKHVVMCDNLWSEDLASENDIQIIKDSENVFILVENSARPTILRELKAQAKAETEVAEAEKDSAFNIFSLSDAFADKDKKTLWILFREAISENIEVEDVHNIISWQVKNLIYAKKNLLRSKLKISPYVASKAKKYTEKWTEEDLENYLVRTTEIYHRSRLGLEDMEISVERMILDL